MAGDVQAWVNGEPLEGVRLVAVSITTEGVPGSGLDLSKATVNTVSFDAQVNPEVIGRLLGVPGARSIAEVAAAIDENLLFPGTAAMGHWVSLEAEAGDLYRLWSDREMRFARAGLESRGLRLDGPFWDGCYSVVPADA